MGKGAETRLAVLDEAVEVARRMGLSGLTIGTLAERTSLSKSGLFGHFRSKEALQEQVVERARDVFSDTVARPALRAPRGEPRIRALFEHWLAWDSLPGGCPFVAASTEFDDRPGPVRDRIVAAHRDLLEMIGTVFQTGVAEGQFRPDADPDQFAQDFYAILLGQHHLARLLDDRRARERAWHAFEALLDQARPAG